MLSFNDFYNQVCCEKLRLSNFFAEGKSVKLIIYIDDVSFNELLCDLKRSIAGKDIESIGWDEKSKTFLGYPVFLVKTTGFHFNVVPVI